MEAFYDEDGNKYYTVKDRLYVDLIQKGTSRHIGNLTYNLNDNTVNLIVYRTKDQKTSFGYFISLHPLNHLIPDKVFLVENNGEKVYYLEWKNTFFNKENPWKFTPRWGYEKQIVLPDAFWNEIKEPKELLI